MKFNKRGLEKLLLDIMEDRGPHARNRFVGGMMEGLSKVYRTMVLFRHFLYDKGFLKKKSLGCLVISVGNITMGGTGKTPVVEIFAKELQKGGRKVAILSRGYKGKARGHQVVSDGKDMLLDVTQAGDEPYMLARNVPGVPVLVGKNRIRTGNRAVEEFGVDTLLLDDGFQYWNLRRHLDILLVDATNPFGNGHLLPRGVLREPLSSLNRVTHFFLTKARGVDTTSIRERIRLVNPHAQIVECTYQPTHLVHVYSGEERELDALSGKTVAILSAIASPQGFEAVVRDLGADIVYTKRFRDHHFFTERQVDRVAKVARGKGAQMLLITEKDAVRFPKLKHRRLPVYYVRVTVEMIKGARDFTDCIWKICN